MSGIQVEIRTETSEFVKCVRQISHELTTAFLMLRDGNVAWWENHKIYGWLG